MRISNKNFLILIASVVAGISLSLFSLNYKQVVSSQPVDYCLGPAVIGFECPELPIEENAGFPLTVEKTYYTYDFGDETDLFSYKDAKRIVVNSSLINLIINSLVLTVSSFLLVSALFYIYKKINNKFIKKSLNILLNITSILLPLFISVGLYFEVNNTIPNNSDPEAINTPMALLAFIWILPFIFIYNINKLKYKSNKLLPLISSILIIVCWFYILVGGLLF